MDKAITITKPADHFASSCNGCFARGDVYELEVNNGRIGHVITLCANCLKKLQACILAINLDGQEGDKADE